METIAEHGCVLLTGEGGDSGLAPSLIFDRGAGTFGLLRGISKYMLTRGHHPRIGFRIAWQRWRGIQYKVISGYPKWFDPGLETRLGLLDRWRKLIIEEPPQAHLYRPDAYNSLTGVNLSSFIETYDASYTRVQVEVRHPLLDLRLQRFFLRLPVLPWCADKELLRVSMQGRLPKAILRRPKCPVRGNPMEAILRATKTDGLNNFAVTPALARYVKPDRIPYFGQNAAAPDPDIDLRPINLNYWLAHVFS
jgi:hypothetical protein